MRILATSTPGMGHLNAIAPLLKTLQHAGHEVLVVTAEEWCDLVEEYGFTVRPGGMGVAERAERFAPRGPGRDGAAAEAAPGAVLRRLLRRGPAVMRRDLLGVFDDFRPDVVIHEVAEQLAAAPMAVSRGIPHVTVAFSGTLLAEAWAYTLAAVTPIWGSEGLAEPAVVDLVGAVYLHPFPPSFGQVPDVPSVGKMRAVGFDSGTIDACVVDRRPRRRPTDRVPHIGDGTCGRGRRRGQRRSRRSATTTFRRSSRSATVSTRRSWARYRRTCGWSASCRSDWSSLGRAS